MQWAGASGRWEQLQPLPDRRRPMPGSAAAHPRGAAPRASGGAALRPWSGSAWGPSPTPAAAVPALPAVGRRVLPWARMRQCEVKVARARWPGAVSLVLRCCGDSPPPSFDALLVTVHGMAHRTGVVRRRRRDNSVSPSLWLSPALRPDTSRDAAIPELDKDTYDEEQSKSFE
ncbi:hypothetical protein U9M48_025066, partial [Paspalum notatum var. saurae]